MPIQGHQLVINEAESSLGSLQDNNIALYMKLIASRIKKPFEVSSTGSIITIGSNVVQQLDASGSGGQATPVNGAQIASMVGSTLAVYQDSTLDVTTGNTTGDFLPGPLPCPVITANQYVWMGVQIISGNHQVVFGTPNANPSLATYPPFSGTAEAKIIQVLLQKNGVTGTWGFLNPSLANAINLTNNPGSSGAGGGISWSTPVDNSIIPDTTNTYDLGSNSLLFRRGFFRQLSVMDIGGQFYGEFTPNSAPANNGVVFNSVAGKNLLINAGPIPRNPSGGSNLYLTGDTVQFHSNNINFSTAGTIDFTGATVTGLSAGEANTASNLGAGTGIFASKVGVDLRFKSLVQGSNITITNDVNTITINSSAISWSTPVNANIVPDGANTRAIGSALLPFLDSYVSRQWITEGTSSTGLLTSDIADRTIYGNLYTQNIALYPLLNGFLQLGNTGKPIYVMSPVVHNNPEPTSTSTTISWSAGNMLTRGYNSDPTITFLGAPGSSSNCQTLNILITNLKGSTLNITWPVGINWPNATPITTIDASRSSMFTFMWINNAIYATAVQNLG